MLTDEEDQWFKDTHDHLSDFERLLDELQGELRFLSDDRKDLSKAMSLLSRSLSALALCEENTILSLTLDKLADLHANASTVQNYDADMTTSLIRVFVDQIQSIKHFKERIVSRSHAWKNLTSNEQLLKQKREAKVQHYLFGKASRVEQVKKEVNELEKYIGTLKDDLARMDALIRSDYEAFAKKRLEDLKAGAVNWLSIMAECEQKVLDGWENLSKEIKRANE